MDSLFVVRSTEYFFSHKDASMSMELVDRRDSGLKSRGKCLLPVLQFVSIARPELRLAVNSEDKLELRGRLSFMRSNVEYLN